MECKSYIRLKNSKLSLELTKLVPHRTRLAVQNYNYGLELLFSMLSQCLKKRDICRFFFQGILEKEKKTERESFTGKSCEAENIFSKAWYISYYHFSSTLNSKPVYSKEKGMQKSKQVKKSNVSYALNNNTSLNKLKLLQFCSQKEICDSLVQFTWPKFF